MRCEVCKIKLTLVQESMGLCRCKKVFCPKHKMAEFHECEYDYKKGQRDLLKKEMMLVVGDKMENRA